MTPDTERALKIIEPIAKALNISVSADNKFLYIDDPYEGETAIGISCNSAYATIMEFIGVLTLRHARDRRWEVSKKQQETIKRYWISMDAVEKMEAKNDD